MVCISCILGPMCMPILTLVGAYLLSLVMPLLKTLHLSKFFGLEGPTSNTPSADPPGMVCTPDGVCSIKRPPPAQKKEGSTTTPVPQPVEPCTSGASSTPAS